MNRNPWSCLVKKFLKIEPKPDHKSNLETPVIPEDVADTVIFLLSDKSKHYTGSTFDINNGGYLR